MATMSRPSRARGLNEFPRIVASCSMGRPSRGAWIETVCRGHSSAGSPCYPLSRARGLKPPKPAFDLRARASGRPLTGAWIETHAANWSSYVDFRCPFAPAWIETKESAVAVDLSNRFKRPFTGAWIETSGEFGQFSPPGRSGALSRARGLKQDQPKAGGIKDCVLPRPPSRARGLKPPPPERPIPTATSVALPHGRVD